MDPVRRANDEGLRVQKRVDPSKLNFIPTPQYLMMDMQNQDIFDAFLINEDSQSEDSTTRSSGGVRVIKDAESRSEEILQLALMKNYAKIPISQNRGEGIQCDYPGCSNEALYRCLDSGNRAYCHRHVLEAIIEENTLLNQSEAKKRDYLKNFIYSIGETKQSLEELKSMLNQNRIEIQEVNSANLKRINSVFKIIFEQTKHLYTTLLDQVGMKVGKCEATHTRTISTITMLENDINVIDNDIDKNYANIVLNMDVDPFKQIMGSYEEKIQQDLMGVQKAKEDLKENSPILLNFKSDFKDEEMELYVRENLFDLITSTLKEQKTDDRDIDPALSRRKGYLANLSSSISSSPKKRKSRRKSKKDLSAFMRITRRNTETVKEEAQKIITDLNKVIAKLEKNSRYRSSVTPKKIKSKLIHQKRDVFRSSKKNSKLRKLRDEFRTNSSKKSNRIESYFSSSNKKSKRSLRSSPRTNTKTSKFKLSGSNTPMISKLQSMFKPQYQMNDRFEYPSVSERAGAVCDSLSRIFKEKLSLNTSKQKKSLALKKSSTKAYLSKKKVKLITSPSPDTREMKKSLGLRARRKNQISSSSIKNQNFIRGGGVRTKHQNPLILMGNYKKKRKSSSKLNSTKLAVGLGGEKVDDFYLKAKLKKVGTLSREKKLKKKSVSRYQYFAGSGSKKRTLKRKLSYNSSPKKYVEKMRDDQSNSRQYLKDAIGKQGSLGGEKLRKDLQFGQYGGKLRRMSPRAGQEYGGIPISPKYSKLKFSKVSTEN